MTSRGRATSAPAEPTPSQNQSVSNQQQDTRIPRERNERGQFIKVTKPSETVVPSGVRSQPWTNLGSEAGTSPDAPSTQSVAQESVLRDLEELRAQARRPSRPTSRASSLNSALSMRSVPEETVAFSSPTNIVPDGQSEEVNFPTCPHFDIARSDTPPEDHSTNLQDMLDLADGSDAGSVAPTPKSVSMDSSYAKRLAEGFLAALSENPDLGTDGNEPKIISSERQHADAAYTEGSRIFVER